jgi:ABC-type dipeptide/oligopeptide/nickel transport system permease subunit
LAGYLDELDAIAMRIVDIMYGLPYMLLVIFMAISAATSSTSFSVWHCQLAHPVTGGPGTDHF